MKVRRGHFWWSEDYDLVLDFWLWLHEQGVIDEGELLSRMSEHVVLDAVDACRIAVTHPEWQRYQPVAEARQGAAKESVRSGFGLDDARLRDGLTTAEARPIAADAKRRYDDMASLGLPPFRVLWVTAPFGQRWFIPSDTIVLGSEGADPVQRRQAVKEAAIELLSGRD